MSKSKLCNIKCNNFRCSKNSIRYKTKVVWCQWTEEPCNPKNCRYAMCVTRRLLPEGICGEKIKRKTIEKRIEDDFQLKIKIKGKTFRKIGEKEIF